MEDSMLQSLERGDKDMQQSTIKNMKNIEIINRENNKTVGVISESRGSRNLLESAESTSIAQAEVNGGTCTNTFINSKVENIDECLRKSCTSVEIHDKNSETNKCKIAEEKPSKYDYCQHNACDSEACQISGRVIDVLTKLAYELSNKKQIQEQKNAVTLFECLRLLQTPVINEENASLKQSLLFVKEGDSMLELHEYGKASSLFTTAIDVSTPNSMLYCKRSICYANMSYKSLALKDALRSVEIDIENVEGNIQLAKCYLNSGHTSMAEQIVNRVLALDPNNVKAVQEKMLIEKMNSFEAKLEMILERGKRFMNVGMYDEAVNELLRAAMEDDDIQLHPEYIKFMADAKSKIDSQNL